MNPLRWWKGKSHAQKHTSRVVASVFRPTLESLDGRIAPHAGPLPGLGSSLGFVGVLSSTDTTQVATHLAVITRPASYAGGETSVMVLALDANNRPVKNYTGTVALSSTDSAATLPASYTFTAEDRGRHVFRITLATEGSQTITVKDTNTDTIVGSAKVNVQAAPVATHLSVKIEKAAYAGQETRVLVVALDANNRPVPTYTGTVNLTSTDTGATLPGSYTFTSADHGAHVFTVTPSTTGEFTLTATDAATDTITGTATVNVTAAPVATKIALFALPAATTGSTISVVVVALDANNRPVKNFTGTVTLTSSDSSLTMPASYTFTAADKGMKTFNVTLGSTAGEVTFTATDSADGTLVGSRTVRVIDPSSIPGFPGGPRGGNGPRMPTRFK